LFVADCSKVLVNYTVKTVFDPLLARVSGDGQSSDKDAEYHVQVCWMSITCIFTIQCRSYVLLVTLRVAVNSLYCKLPAYVIIILESYL